MKLCLICGAQHQRRGKTCSAACGTEHEPRYNRQYMRRQRGVEMADAENADAIGNLTHAQLVKLARIAFNFDLFRFCIVCGAPFHANDLRKVFCSRACNSNARLAKARRCLICGVPIEITHSHDVRVVCSERCLREQAARRNRRYRRTPGAIVRGREYLRKRRKKHREQMNAYSRDYQQKKRRENELKQIRGVIDGGDATRS